MALKASNYKNWCTDNISPQAWARVVLKCLNLVRERGLSMSEMEKADPDLELDEELLMAINEALMEMYEVSVDESLLVRY